MEFTEVIRRRRMIRGFTTEPLPAGTADRLLEAAVRAPSAGFSQGFSFLVLEGAEQCTPLWRIVRDDVAQLDDARVRDIVEALTVAPLVIVPMASKEIYLARYAKPDKGWTDQDEASWPVPYWYIDAGFASLLILLSVVDSELGAVFIGPPGLEAFRAEFGVPPEWTPIGTIVVGHPDPEADPLKGRRPRQRKPLTEVVHRGHW